MVWGSFVVLTTTAGTTPVSTFLREKQKHEILNIKTSKEKLYKQIDNALGKGARECYLEQNPHGFTRVTKVHKNAFGLSF